MPRFDAYVLARNPRNAGCVGRPLDMLLLAISTALALIYAVLKPLGDGLFDTSMCVAKILAPKDVGDNAKQFLKITQASLMDGWLSNIPFSKASR